MTDLTDQAIRDMLEWARIAVASKDNQEHEPWVTAARVILATVDAPAPTLTERLREQFHYPEQTDEQHGIILDAAQMERDLAEARADVERLTAERDRIASGRYITYAEVDGKPVQKGAESNAESLDPAEVKPGEVWIVECRGERRTAVKDNGIDIPWNTINADGWYLSEDNEKVTLVTRLVPAPRVITNADELEQLAATSIIRDGRGWPGGVTDQGVIMINGFCLSDEDVLERGPATVLWEPEA